MHSTNDDVTFRRPLARRAFLAGTAASATAAILAACGGGTAPTGTAAPAAAATTGTGATSATSAAAPTTPSTRPPAAATTGTGTTGAGAATTGAPAMASPAASAAASPAAGGTTAAAPAAATMGMGKPGGSILIGTLGEAKTINPFASSESEGNWRIKMLFDQFVRLKPDTFAPKPGLAKSWKIDGLTFTFTLQDGLKFSDGSDLTADDVAFTIRGILNKATASTRASKLLSIMGAREFNAGTAMDVAGVKVVDPKTLAITLAVADASFLANLAYVSPVPKKLLDGKDLSLASKEAFFQKPVGAGPFVFQSWQVGGDFVATKNPNYYQKGLPYLDKFTHRVIADSQSLVNALLAGDIDASIYPSPAGAKQLQAKSDLAVLVTPYTSPDGWQFNFKNPYLAKKEVRQAVAYALDMTQFAKDSLYGLGAPGVGPVSPSNFVFDKTLKPIPYDLEKAKALIKMAGQPDKPPTFSVNKGNVLREDFLTYTQSQLEKAGLKITPEAGEYATLTDREVKKDFDVFGAGITGVTASAGDLYDYYATDGSQNFGSYTNPKLDDILKQARQELSTDKQVGLYAQAQAILMDDLPCHWAWYRPFLHVTKKKFTGYVDSADTGGFFSELETWYVNG